MYRTGYGKQSTSSLLSRQNVKSNQWVDARYVIFDLPEVQRPFRERVKQLKKSSPKITSKFVSVTEHVSCRGKQHLEEFSEKILDRGGEGVMLREPNSYYVHRRSNCLKKFKVRILC